MNPRSLIWIGCLFVLGILCTFLFFKPAPSLPPSPTAALAEIDRLLLPLAQQNIIVEDFSTLKHLTKHDEAAQEEILQLERLVYHREYAHVGHGLTHLYEYVKTGKEEHCPPHSLAHYYVFKNHSEHTLAQHNLETAQEYFGQWNASLVDHNVSYQTIAPFVAATLATIKGGDDRASPETISLLADMPCP